MREALHKIDNELVQIPYSATAEEVQNLKQLAKKDLFECPHCKAKLIVRSGVKIGLHFSHLHGEACEVSKQIDKSEKKYIKQIERESNKHRTIVDIIYDELSVSAKINPSMIVERGYKSTLDLNEYPDIVVKINKVNYAISVITNVGTSEDVKLNKLIQNRHQSFLKNELTPIWFIERKEQAIEKEKNSIVLWESELTISIKTNQDHQWDNFLNEVIEDKYFFAYYKYPISMEELNIDVRSIYYIYEENENIMVKVQRFLKDRINKPIRAFLLNDGYTISFAAALAIENGFRLSSNEIEEKNRVEFLERFKELEQEVELQRRFLEENQKNQKKTITNKMSYIELTKRLQVKINLRQREQMELWTKFIPRIGLVNCKIVWDIVEENDCKSFDELRKILKIKY